MTAKPDVPESWQATTVGAVAKRVVVGFVGAGKRHYVAHGGVPFLMGKNVRDGAIDLADLQHVSEEFHASQKKSQLAAGDVIVVRIGRSGEAAVVPEDLPPANCAGLVIVKGPMGVLPEFLSKYLNSPEGQRRAAKEVRGVTRRTLNTKSVAGAHLPLPPLDTQKRIVDKIDGLMARSRRAKEALDAIPPLLDRFRQSVLAAAFRGDLTADWRAQNPDVEPAEHLLERIRTERRRRWEEDYLAKQRAKGKEPKNDKWKSKYKATAPLTRDSAAPPLWRRATVDEIATHVVDCLHSTPKYSEEGIPAVRTADVRRGVLDLAKARRVSEEVYAGRIKRLEPREGDVLYSREGERFGLAATVPSSTRLCLAQRMMQVRPAPSMHARWVMWAMNSPQVYALARQDVGGSTSPHVNMSSIRGFPLAVPPIAEQAELDRRLSATWARLAAIEHSLRVSSARCDALDRKVLSAAFTGDLTSP